MTIIREIIFLKPTGPVGRYTLNITFDTFETFENFDTFETFENFDTFETEQDTYAGRQ